MTRPSDFITNESIEVNSTESIELTLEFVDSSVYRSLEKTGDKRIGRLKADNQRLKSRNTAKHIKGRVNVFFRSSSIEAVIKI